MAEEMQTRREKIINILLTSEEPLSARDIALFLDERDIRLILNDLKHIAKSVRKIEGGKYQLVMVPAQCRKCGFVFKEGASLDPSRCPKCKSEWISPPKFKIIKKER
ncbi:MAG: transcriptional regulator [Candidatus Asgardarchaeia archaeon]